MAVAVDTDAHAAPTPGLQLTPRAAKPAHAADGPEWRRAPRGRHPPTLTLKKA
jgi:hypothetical protein